MRFLGVEYTPVVAAEIDTVYGQYEEGRCDAVLFCSDTAFVPPDDGDELDRFGLAVDGIGDVNYDGYDDVVAVSGQYEGTFGATWIYVFHGSAAWPYGSSHSMARRISARASS